MGGRLGKGKKSLTVLQKAQDGFFINNSLGRDFSTAPHRVCTPKQKRRILLAFLKHQSLMAAEFDREKIHRHSTLQH